MTRCRSLPFALRALLLAAITALPFAAVAQNATATLSGTVVDPNGAVVPGANITLTETTTGLQRTATTNEQGYFAIPLLKPSNYTLLVAHDGFTTAEVRDVVLNVGDQRALRIPLKTGDIKETVNITGEAPLINESPAVATTIDRQLVGNLPLNGRSFQSLILLTPGVTVASGGTNSDIGQFSVNGQRASTNSFIVDGVSGNIGSSTSAGLDKNLSLAGSYPGLSAFGGTNNLVSVDALEEFKIQTSTYSAEFGRQPGAQVSLLTRSGTNQFHGTIFEYLRNEALDARNYFNTKPAPKTPLRQNQFGGTFSGPIVHNRTFLFFSYEGQRLRLPTSGVVNVPSVRLRQVAASSVQPILNAFPVPTGPETIVNCTATDPLCAPPGFPAGKKPSGFAPWNFGVSNPGTLDAMGIRIDHLVNAKMTLFGRYNDSPSEVSSGTFLRIHNITSTQTLTLGVTSLLNARLTNEFRLNYSRQQAKQSRVVIGGAPVDEPLLTNGLGGLGIVRFQFNGNAPVAHGGVYADSYQRQFNIVDNISFVTGSHRFKFGLDYRRLSPTYGLSSQQSVTFRSELDVRNAIASSVSVNSVASARPRFTNFSTYVQDTWKTTSRLTLDLGLRWDLNPPPTEPDGKLPPVLLGIVDTDVSQAVLAPPGTRAYKTVYTAFAPRFGGAYQLNQKAGRETVLRGGFGVYYDLGSGGAISGFPFVGFKSLSNRPFPLSAADAARPPVTIPESYPVTSLVSSSDPKLKPPYALQWNFAVEQSLGTTHVVSVSYVASATRRLLTTQFLNNGAGFVGPLPNPNFPGGILYTFNGSTANYQSMQAQYRARLKNGLQALVNYTWSHAIDDASSDIGSGILDRGDADFDTRHNFSGAINYGIPSIKAGKIVSSIFRQWSLDAIVHAQSGQPIDVYSDLAFVRGDGVFFNLRPDVISGVPFYIDDPTAPGGRRFNAAAFGNPPVDASGNPLRQGNFGRNVLRQLPLYQFDLALARSLSLTEKWKLKFRAEVFNVFNHPMFTVRFNNIFTSPSTFGVPSFTLNSGLGGLNALYQLGGPRSIQLSAKLEF